MGFREVHRACMKFALWHANEKLVKARCACVHDMMSPTRKVWTRFHKALVTKETFLKRRLCEQATIAATDAEIWMKLSNLRHIERSRSSHEDWLLSVQSQAFADIGSEPELSQCWA